MQVVRGAANCEKRRTGGRQLEKGRLDEVLGVGSAPGQCEAMSEQARRVGIVQVRQRAPVAVNQPLQTGCVPVAVAFASHST